MNNDEGLQKRGDLIEINQAELELVGGAGWRGALFGAAMGGAEAGVAGAVIGAVVGYMTLD